MDYITWIMMIETQRREIKALTKENRRMKRKINIFKKWIEDSIGPLHRDYNYDINPFSALEKFEEIFEGKKEGEELCLR